VSTLTASRPERRRLDEMRRRNPYVRGLTSGQGLAGLAVVLVIVLLGVLAPVLTPFAPNAQSASALAAPGGAHLLGTDEFGRDLFSRLLHGILIDLWIGLLGVPASAVLGVGLGLITSLWRPLEIALQRLFDVIFAFPTLILALLVAIVAGQGLTTVVVTVIISGVPVFGRLTRSEVLRLSPREYVTAARVVGVSRLGVLFRHLLPNMLPVLVVQAALAFAAAIFLEGGMSLVGIGVQLPDPSLGNMLGESIPYLSKRPLFGLAPMIAVTALVAGFNGIADGLNRGLRAR
jgi:peptide/nickel transport system permease protein